MAPSSSGEQRGLGPPPAFAQAVASARSAGLRPEVVIEETPPPQRLAPYAFALSATVTVEDTELATGRLVLLYDPAGHESWAGQFRLVTYVRTDVDQEMSGDPLLPAVAWGWLTEALQAYRASYTAPSGTVTRVSWEGFGGMADDPPEAHIEIRASWTPLSVEIAPHVAAWTHVMCTSAGLPPLPAGVVAMPAQRESTNPRGRNRR